MPPTIVGPTRGDEQDAQRIVERFIEGSLNSVDPSLNDNVATIARQCLRATGDAPIRPPPRP